MSKNKQKTCRPAVAILLTAIILAAAAIISARVLSEFELNIKYNSDNVSVTGRACQTVAAQTGSFVVTLNTRAGTYQEAYRTLRHNRELLLQTLAGRSMTPEEINEGVILLKVNYLLNDQGNLTNQVFDRELQQTVTVKSARLDKITAAAQAVSDLLSQGVELNRSQIEFTFFDQEQYRNQLLETALLDAKKQLELIARGSNSKIGEYTNIYPGLLTITCGKQPGQKELSLTVDVAAALIRP